jgi:hypothetical protein
LLAEWPEKENEKFVPTDLHFNSRSTTFSLQAIHVSPKKKNCTSPPLFWLNSINIGVGIRCMSRAGLASGLASNAESPAGHEDY